MSEVATVVEINCTTGEVIERPLTTDELTQREADRVVYEARKAEEEAAQAAVEAAKASAQAKLSALGLTAEEISALTK